MPTYYGVLVRAEALSWPRVPASHSSGASGRAGVFSLMIVTPDYMGSQGLFRKPTQSPKSPGLNGEPV